MNSWHEFVAKRREAYPHILADHQAGMGGAELAEKYGMSRQRIYRIVKKLSVPIPPQRGGARSSPTGHRRRLKREKKRINGTGHGKSGGSRKAPPTG